MVEFEYGGYETVRYVTWTTTRFCPPVEAAVLFSVKLSCVVRQVMLAWPCPTVFARTRKVAVTGPTKSRFALVINGRDILARPHQQLVSGLHLWQQVFHLARSSHLRLRVQYLQLSARRSPFAAVWVLVRQFGEHVLQEAVVLAIVGLRWPRRLKRGTPRIEFGLKPAQQIPRLFSKTIVDSQLSIWLSDIE